MRGAAHRLPIIDYFFPIASDARCVARSIDSVLHPSILHAEFLFGTVLHQAEGIEEHRSRHDLCAKERPQNASFS